MKLLKLTYRAADEDWGFTDLTFEPDITLIVGASGVGKTRILEAIFQLHRISTSASDRDNHFWGIEWDCSFALDTGSHCRWSGRFESEESRTSVELGLETDQDGPRLIRESLLIDERDVFRRDEKTVWLQGKPVEIRISSFDSCLDTFQEAPDIETASAALKSLFFADDFGESQFYGLQNNPKWIGSYQRAVKAMAEIDHLRHSGLDTFVKSLIAFENELSVADTIADNFKDVFPMVESVFLDRPSKGPNPGMPGLFFRERGVRDEFPFTSLSAGMQSTFLHLARLALSADGSVVMIDEFETGLGANCINVVAKRLMNDNARLQFIATSHHPYIINAIPMDRLRVIGRTGGEVKAYTVAELKLGRSKHTSFTQLINTELFQTGMVPDEPVPAG